MIHLDRDDVNVVLVDLPCTIKEYVVANKDLTFTVVLNAKHSSETRLQAYKHALSHIDNGDFEKTCSADLIEVYAHDTQCNKRK